MKRIRSSKFGDAHNQGAVGTLACRETSAREWLAGTLFQFVDGVERTAQWREDRIARRLCNAAGMDALRLQRCAGPGLWSRPGRGPLRVGRLALPLSVVGCNGDRR